MSRSSPRLPGGPRVRVCALWLLSAAALWAPAASAERPRVYALEGATVVVKPGVVVEDATVVLRDGLVESVGAGIPVPPDAEVLDQTGRWIYPGFVDPDADWGPASDSRASSGGSPGGPGGPAAASASGRPEPGPFHSVDLVRPELRAAERLLPIEGDRAREAARYRELGFTAMLARPNRGIFRGRSALFLLRDSAPVSRLLVRPEVAQHCGFDRERFGRGYPSSLMGAVAIFRQVLLDTERYRTWKDRFARRPRGMERPEFVSAYEALLPVLAGSQPVIFHLQNPLDVRLADGLAREFGLQAVLAGTGLEWEVLEDAVRAGRTLILPLEPPEKPKTEGDEALETSLRALERYARWDEGPARLHQAGVRIAFTTRSLKNLADFHRNLRKVVEAGLDETSALAALTTVPADIAGASDLLGTLEAGKIANVVVADGPLFAENTRVERVFVDGVEYPVEKKKKPKGDPNAVVDPRGTWSVVFEIGGRTIQRIWTITGEQGAYEGTAETRRGTVPFDRIELEGNVLTVVLSGPGGRGATEITVVVAGDTFEGTAEMGSRSVTVRGTRTEGPDEETAT